MIIGETFNSDYDGYEEDSYDYLFKRKTKEERQQKRTERKEKRADKKQQKQDPASGGKRRLPILGNFGLFDKNKKKNATGTSDTSNSSSAKKEPGDTSESSTGEEKKIAMASAGVAAATQDKSEGGNNPGSESTASGTDTAKLENKELDKNGKPKEAGFGPMFGFAMLGVTVLVIGIVLYGTNKKSKEILAPMKVAA